MHIHVATFLQRLLPGSRRTFVARPFRGGWPYARARYAVLAGAVVVLSLAAVACSGDDDDDPDATQAGAAAATSTPAAGATVQPTVVAGTLVPLDTATPAAPTATAAAGASAAGNVAMIDMTPCGDTTYYEEQIFDGGVPALTYKDVPVGTPILFPFEEGRLRDIDARQGAIVLSYDVEGVGIFSVQAAGSDTLDRTISRVEQGSVIGHFGGSFGEEETDAFVGYQLFAVAGTAELTRIGGTFFAGEPLNPEVTHCLILP